VLGVSALGGEGIAEVRALLAPGRTGVFVGASGAGKSTLVNALAGAALQPTAAVRERDARGRHTTTGRRLVALPGGGAVIDGPGIRELKLWDGEGLDVVFEDVAAAAEGCRFRDCSHEDEPGCAVRAAVEAGQIPPARLESYHKLQQELAFQARQQDQRAQLEQKRKWKVLTKAASKHIRDKRK
jgi:ribosome biogenesis GTPase